MHSHQLAANNYSCENLTLSILNEANKALSFRMSIHYYLSHLSGNSGIDTVGFSGIPHRSSKIIAMPRVFLFNTCQHSVFIHFVEEIEQSGRKSIIAIWQAKPGYRLFIGDLGRHSQNAYIVSASTVKVSGTNKLVYTYVYIFSDLNHKQNADCDVVRTKHTVIYLPLYWWKIKFPVLQDKKCELCQGLNKRLKISC